ncbi:molybdopterin molybdotransferase MoeA [Pseudoclavibacter endophyticus]|uniref:Molybdopterin molybdenumtransferase n=1 Tax=Pseudoclavibacter endophyticus TaxID=1778590 RepID=A0A6H9WMK8_9MICO|nr:molybdopterin molybdotransferase MoeA [Pseudoclavibacter endophyticus]
MVSLETHLASVLRESGPLAPVTVPIEQGLGLRLAADIVAVHALPTVDNSAMDGYAVRRASVAGASPAAPVRLRVVADIPAGSGDDPALRDGECARIMTGAPVPSDADAIVPFEATTLGTDIATAAPEAIDVTNEPRPAAHIRRRGEDIEPGELVLPAGARLGARAVAAAIAAGATTAVVVPRPRVAVVSTGDELLPAGAPLTRGRIPDSNSPLLAGLVTEAGAELARVERAGDEPGPFIDALYALARDVDVVITTGGVSVGAFDVVRIALEERGVEFHKVAMQPGKPQGFGRLARSDGEGRSGPLMFCLPGNPVSVFVSFEAFVRPALRALAGEVGPAHIERVGIASEGWRCPPGRLQLMPVRTLGVDGNGRSAIAPATAGGSGSHLVARLARADALAIAPADAADVRVGDELTIWEVLP